MQHPVIRFVPKSDSEFRSTILVKIPRNYNITYMQLVAVMSYCIHTHTERERETDMIGAM